MTDRRPYTLILTILLSAGSVRAQDRSEFPIGAWFPGLFIHDQTPWNARLQLVDAANFNTIHAALENQTTSGLTHAQLNQRNQDNITGADVELARTRAIITYRDHAGNNRVVTRESPVLRAEFNAANVSQPFEVVYHPPPAITDRLGNRDNGREHRILVRYQVQWTDRAMSRWSGSGPTIFGDPAFFAATTTRTSKGIYGTTTATRWTLPGGSTCTTSRSGKSSTRAWPTSTRSSRG